VKKLQKLFRVLRTDRQDSGFRDSFCRSLEAVEIRAVATRDNFPALMLKHKSDIAAMASGNVRAPQCLLGVNVTFQSPAENFPQCAAR